MTTLAFKDNILAADGRCTEDGVFVTRMPKIFRLANKALLGGAGDADMRDVCVLLGSATPKRMPTRAELAATKTDFRGILVFPNGTIFFVDIGVSENGTQNEWTATVLECRERYAASGSGAAFALGAMAAGRTAKQAVEIACRFDMYSGPPVVEVPLKPDPKGQSQATKPAAQKRARKVK